MARAPGNDPGFDFSAVYFVSMADAEGFSVLLKRNETLLNVVRGKRFVKDFIVSPGRDLDSSCGG